MKKINLLSIIVILLIVVFSGCGSGGSDGNDNIIVEGNNTDSFDLIYPVMKSGDRLKLEIFSTTLYNDPNMEDREMTSIQYSWYTGDYDILNLNTSTEDFNGKISTIIEVQYLNDTIRNYSTESFNTNGDSTYITFKPYFSFQNEMEVGKNYKSSYISYDNVNGDIDYNVEFKDISLSNISTKYGDYTDAIKVNYSIYSDLNPSIPITYYWFVKNLGAVHSEQTIGNIRIFKDYKYTYYFK